MRFPRLSVPSLPSVITFLVVAASSLFVFIELHPRLLLMDTLTSGGDMGAHTWAPWYMKHHLLPHGRLSGWTPDWYDGFPAFTFYFPFPAVITVILSYLMPYAVAFKLVTVSGVVSLPISAWAYGKLSRLPFPVPACLAAATVPFLFDSGFTIFGGNIASTLAGEYMFSVGLSLAFLFLGVVTGGLDTNKRRGWAAVLFALIILSHILIAIFALSAGLLIVFMRLIAGGSLPPYKDVEPAPRNRYSRLSIPPLAIGLLLIVFGLLMNLVQSGGRDQNGYLFVGFLLLLLGGALQLAHYFSAREPRLPKESSSGWASRRAAIRWAVSVGVIGGLLSAWWALPFVAHSNYMNDMGWEKIGVGVDSGIKLYDQTIRTYTDALFPSGLTAILIAGCAGAALSLYFRRRVGIFWMLVAVASAVGFVVMPQGRLWNARLLPFYYLSMYMLAGLLIAEIGWGLAAGIRKLRDGRDYADGLQLAAPIIAFVLALVIVVPKLPTPDWWPSTSNWPWHDPATNGVNFIPGWAEWNYAGYDGKKPDGTYYKPAYTEYQSVIDMMSNVGNTYGCGRVMWEYEPTLDRFGTPMALMLLPLHTGGCMGSEEGLFFESSATVPYHFLNQAELSAQPSSAMRDLPYGSLDVSDGITKLQMLGVRYYLAVSPTAQSQADADARLTKVASVPAANGDDGSARTWNVYLINAAEQVAALNYEPNVMTDFMSIETRRNGKPETKLSPREAWLENSLAYYKDPANYDVPFAADGPSSWPRVKNATEVAQRVAIKDPARVTQVSVGDDRISFHVDNPGSPVVVRASYFPNWQADGAKGPYRITPNLMVVIPTKNDVTLHYGRTSVDYLGITLTFIGMIGVAFLVRADRRVGDAPLDPEYEETYGTTPDPDEPDSPTAENEDADKPPETASSG